MVLQLLIYHCPSIDVDKDNCQVVAELSLIILAWPLMRVAPAAVNAAGSGKMMFRLTRDTSTAPQSLRQKSNVP